MFGIPRRLTAFACAVDSLGRVLMIRHERLGVVRWELPGGHVEPGESVRAAAERETAEETGVRVVASDVVAEAVHRWRGAEVGIVYLRATPEDGAPAVSRVSDPAIQDVRWIDPSDIRESSTSPLAHPVITHLLTEDSSRPLLFDATHHETASGWQPVVRGMWHSRVPCRGGQNQSDVRCRPIRA